MVSNQKYFWEHIYSKYEFDIEIPEDIGLDFDFKSILDKQSVKLIDKIKHLTFKKLKNCIEINYNKYK